MLIGIAIRYARRALRKGSSVSYCYNRLVFTTFYESCFSQNLQNADALVRETTDIEQISEDQCLSDLPNDPGNAKTKRRSWIAVAILGAALCLDYTMAMMSIQALYYSLRGPDNLYGLTFGAYDLMGLITAPLFGYWHDATKNYALLFHISTLANVLGNFIYAFCYLGGAWYMMLIGRLIAGAATGSLGLGSTYIAEVTSMHNRQEYLVTYRVSQSVARTVGPFVGYLFLGLPNVAPNSSTALKVKSSIHAFLPYK